jgi:hypothetical protein
MRWVEHVEGRRELYVCRVLERKEINWKIEV